MTKAIVRDRFYVPLKAVDASTVRELLEVPWKTKSLCRPQCPLAMQQGAYCSTCPSKGAKVKLWEVKTTRAGRKMLAFPSGDESILDQLVPNATVIDKRTNPKMRSALRWTGKLRDGSLNEKGRPTPNQKKMLRDWLRHTKVETGGLVISPPRSGKTVIGVSAAMATRSRTFITASKIDFLRQFGRRFGELTNLRQLYAAGKRPVILIDPKGWKDGPACGVHVLKKWGPDVDRADVVMFCYQQMLDTEGGRARMHRYVNGKFGLGIGDEIHQSGAPCFSRVFNRVNVRRRLGLTATPKRKDGLMGVSTAVMGRIASVGTVASDLPELKLFETGVGASSKYANWSSMVKYLTKMEERNRLILKQVFADLRADPRNCVLIPCTRREHIHSLIKMINAQADHNRTEKQEDWPTELAVAYYGKSDTNAVLNQIGTGRARVTVAMMSMIQYGLDVARWTHVYVGVIPTSNPYNVYQALNRVCTPYPPELRKQLGEKPPSVVRYMIDEMSASVFCFKKLFDDPDYGIVANLKGTNYFGIKLASISHSTLERMTAIAAYPKSYSARDVGVNIVLGKTRTGRRRKHNAWSPKKNITRF